MLPTNYGRFYQNSDNSATLKQKLKNNQIQAGQALQACYDKLPKPAPFTSPDGKHRTGLKRIGGGIERCDCGHYWVNKSQREDVAVWHCEKCGIPRLALRPKTDIELISTLLSDPRLKGWERFFTKAMRGKRLGSRQREKLQGIAQGLGISLSLTCSTFDTDNSQSTH